MDVLSGEGILLAKMRRFFEMNGVSKPLLIGILVATLAALTAAVWYQQVHFGRDLENVQKKLKEDQERSRMNRPFVPEKTSGRADLLTPGVT